MFVLIMILVLLVLPYILGTNRGIRIGRSTMKSHRESVRIGARLGRWQLIVGFFLFVALFKLL